MSYLEPLLSLFNRGEDYAAVVERADSLLEQHPNDLRLADLRHRARKKLLATDLSFTNEWFPLWQGVWVDTFEKLQWDRQKTHQIIEIGAFEGQCTSWLSEVLLGADNSRVLVIDPFIGSMEHDEVQKSALFDRFSHNVNLLGKGGRVSVKRQYSSDALPELICQKVQADLIYVDGSHTARDVLADAVMAWPLLVPGGLMIFDDYQWQHYNDNPALNPKMAIDAFIACYFSEIRLLPWGQSYQLLIAKKG